MKKLLARSDATYWPTHGPAITDPAIHVSAMIEHREQREVAIAGALADGVNHIPDIVTHLYEGLPEKLHAAAARTVHSHLIHMIETGRARAEGEATAEAAYGRVD